MKSLITLDDERCKAGGEKTGLKRFRNQNHVQAFRFPATHENEHARHVILPALHHGLIISLSLADVNIQKLATGSIVFGRRVWTYPESSE